MTLTHAHTQRYTLAVNDVRRRAIRRTHNNSRLIHIDKNTVAAAICFRAARTCVLAGTSVNLCAIRSDYDLIRLPTSNNTDNEEDCLKYFMNIPIFFISKQYRHLFDKLIFAFGIFLYDLFDLQKE